LVPTSDSSDDLIGIGGPIQLRGFSEAAFDRAARIGDGFLFSGRTQTEATQIKARIEAKLVELGLDNDGFGFEPIQQAIGSPSHYPTGDKPVESVKLGSHGSGGIADLPFPNLPFPVFAAMKVPVFIALLGVR
jgi:hypothetical protein